jgi:hypothetical protein
LCLAYISSAACWRCMWEPFFKPCPRLAFSEAAVRARLRGGADEDESVVELDWLEGIGTARVDFGGSVDSVCIADVVEDAQSIACLFGWSADIANGFSCRLTRLERSECEDSSSSSVSRIRLKSLKNPTTSTVKLI